MVALFAAPTETPPKPRGAVADRRQCGCHSGHRAEIARDALGDGERGGKRSSFGRPHADLKFATVVDRNEVFAHQHEQRKRAEHHQHADRDHGLAMRHGPLQHPACNAGPGSGRSANPWSSACSAPVFAAGHFDEARAQHRRQRERHQQRDRDGERRRESEGRHEASDDAAHESDGKKHGQQRKRGRHHGQADIACVPSMAA